MGVGIGAGCVSDRGRPLTERSWEERMDGTRQIDDVDVKVGLLPDDSVAGLAMLDDRPPPRNASESSLVETKPDTADAESARVRGFYEAIYQQAEGEAERVPWADQKPNPILVAWLNAEAAAWVRPGARAVVVGCGLGDDLAELSCRGYDVCGFDISPTAIAWSKKRFPDLAYAMQTADLLELPGKLCKRFDLVIEAYTLQSLPPSLRQRAARAVASLTHKHGVVLTICRGRDEVQPLSAVQGPPYPLAARELDELMRSAGMTATREIDDFLDDETPSVRRLRATWRWAE